MTMDLATSSEIGGELSEVVGATTVDHEPDSRAIRRRIEVNGRLGFFIYRNYSVRTRTSTASTCVLALALALGAVSLPVVTTARGARRRRTVLLVLLATRRRLLRLELSSIALGVSLERLLVLQRADDVARREARVVKVSGGEDGGDDGDEGRRKSSEDEVGELFLREREALRRELVTSRRHLVERLANLSALRNVVPRESLECEEIIEISCRPISGVESIPDFLGGV